MTRSANRIMGVIMGLAMAFFALPMAQAASGKSIYQVGGNWLNQDNVKMTLDDLKGKKQVISMVYTHCEHTCPTIVKTMRDVQKALPENLKDKVGFVLVSFTPRSDTPPVFKAFGEKFGVDDKWNLLTGNDRLVRKLAMTMNIQYRPMANSDQIAHSNTITVLNEEGEIVYQLKGFQAGIKPILEALEK